MSVSVVLYVRDKSSVWRTPRVMVPLRKRPKQRSCLSIAAECAVPGCRWALWHGMYRLSHFFKGFEGSRFIDYSGKTPSYHVRNRSIPDKQS